LFPFTSAARTTGATTPTATATATATPTEGRGVSHHRF
jgi:hypothetical protein